MKKPLIGAAAVLTLVVAGALTVVAMQPDTLHVERSATMAAAPADVFPFANDYSNWGEWDPWRAKDPDMVATISEPSAGVGAWTAWQGNDQVGKGKMTITDSQEPVRVVQKLEFFEPWESTAIATVALAPDGDGTRVTWSFDSEQTFMAKAMHLIMDMDAMLGPDFEQGLANLKVAAERAASARLDAERAASAADEAAGDAERAASAAGDAAAGDAAAADEGTD